MGVPIPIGDILLSLVDDCNRREANTHESVVRGKKDPIETFVNAGLQ
jgi:hypothetical protein